MLQKVKTNYWYTASYKSAETGLTAEATGGLSAQNEVGALSIAYDDLETLGEVIWIYIYELKEQGELGDMVIQVGGSRTPKEHKSQTNKEETPKDLDDCVALESIAIRTHRLPPRVLNQGDYDE